MKQYSVVSMKFLINDHSLHRPLSAGRFKQVRFMLDGRLEEVSGVMIPRNAIIYFKEKSYG